MMKYIILTLFLLTGTINVKGQDLILKCDTVSVEEILKTDYKEYIGKQVKELLLADYIRNYESYVFVDVKRGVLTGILLNLSDNFFVEIIVDEYEFLERYNVEKNWDFNLFKEEKISRIRFLKNEEVILEVK